VGELKEARFEDRLDALMDQYEENVAEDPNYIGSDEYLEFVDKVERVSDRHQSFVDRQESAVGRIDHAIDNTGDRIERIDDLQERLADREPLSDSYREFLEQQLQNAENRANNRIDKLNMKQDTLQTNVTQYEAFQTDIETFLGDVRSDGNLPLTAAVTATDIAIAFAAINQADAAPFVSNLSSTGSPATLDSTGRQNSGSIVSIPAIATAALTAGTSVSQSLGGGAGAIGGADVTFDDQSGGKFSAQHFVSVDENLAALIGQVAVDEINFKTVGESVQGWELHFDGEFEGSVEVTLGYDENVLPEGFDETLLTLMHFDSNKGEWEIPAGFSVDPETNQFHFSVTSFSPFIMSFSPASSALPEPATGLALACLLVSSGLVRIRRRR
jgi:hypothetical protein